MRRRHEIDIIVQHFSRSFQRFSIFLVQLGPQRKTEQHHFSSRSTTNEKSAFPLDLSDAAGDLVSG